MTLTIRKVECWACDIPVERPFCVGRFTVRKRSYLAVRIHTSEGIIADCVTQTRGSPLDVVLAEVIAPHLVGRNALDIGKRRQELQRALTAMEFDGAVGRAWSAAEICLQDLRAQAAGWPLWRLLGGEEPAPVPVVLVEGYALDGEGDEAFVDRLAARVAEGYVKLKLEAGHYGEARQLLRRLELFRAKVGNDCALILDFAWSWENAKDNLGLAREMAAFGVEWIEDPLPRTDVDNYVRLRAHCTTPIGCGDETSRATDLTALMEADALDIVRVDATTIGGIEVLRELTAAAMRKQLRVSYHEHPEVHEHCVFGLGTADHIEMFPTDRPFDRVHDLIHDSSFDRVRHGKLAPLATPGTGIRLRDEALAKLARRHFVVEA